MVHRPFVMSAIAAVAVAAILMLGTLAAISTNNRVSAQESSNTGNVTRCNIASHCIEAAVPPLQDPLQEIIPAMPHEILKCPASPLSEAVVVCTTINHASAQESSRTSSTHEACATLAGCP